MYDENKITIVSNHRKVTIAADQILYIRMRRKHADVYMNNGDILETRTTFKEFIRLLGERFIEIRRGSLVSAMAVHSITDTINLNSGDSLAYTLSRRREIEEKLYQQRRKLIRGFSTQGTPVTTAEYCEYYKGFEYMPFAFADIEMIFEDDCHAVDWVFRYGNPALARLEKLPLEQLIDHTFGSLFPNMDEKWLRIYERAILCGETLGMSEYSPEIEKELSIVCFPTFEGHCGCILLDTKEVNYIRSVNDVEGVIKLLPGILSGNDQ